MIFSTDIIRKFWAEQSAALEKYCYFVNGFDFISARDAIKSFSDQLKAYECSLQHETDAVLNDCFYCSALLDVLISYAEYWNNISQKASIKSWSVLQDIQDGLRVLKKFTNADETFLCKFFQNQCENLEKLYPYRIFSSIEAVYGEIECSICGKNMDSFNCSHRAGELYRGKIAYGTVKEIKSFCGAALVLNPKDKRCVVSYSEQSSAFSRVLYLANLILERRLNPFKFLEARPRKIEISRKELVKVGRNDGCPCGSGKKYKKCCLGKALVTKNHIDIVGAEKEMLLSEHLINI